MGDTLQFMMCFCMNELKMQSLIQSAEEATTALEAAAALKDKQESANLEVKSKLVTL